MKCPIIRPVLAFVWSERAQYHFFGNINRQTCGRFLEKCIFLGVGRDKRNKHFISIYLHRNTFLRVSWLDFTTLGSQFAYKRNSIGPIIEPWGTPYVTGSAFDENPRAVTLWKRLWRWESNQEGKFPPKPWWCSVVWSFQLLTSAEKNFKNAWTNSLNLLLVGTLFFFFSFFSKLSRQEIHTVVFFAISRRREIWIKLLSSFVFDNT